MSMVWKKVNGLRHVYVNGSSVCGVAGLEQTGDALPCEDCYAQINATAAAAFPE